MHVKTYAWPTVSALPESLLEMQNMELTFDLLNQNLNFSKVLR